MKKARSFRPRLFAFSAHCSYTRRSQTSCTRWSASLLHHHLRPLPRRSHIPHQVHQVDPLPHVDGKRLRLLIRHLGKAMEVRARIAERRALQQQEALHVPLPDVLFGGVHVDRKINQVAGKNLRRLRPARQMHLQQVQPLQNQNLRPPYLQKLVGNNVIAVVRIHRNLQLLLALPQRDHKVQHPAQVVALRKTLPLHQPALFQHLVGIAEIHPSSPAPPTDDPTSATALRPAPAQTCSCPPPRCPSPQSHR